MKRIFVLMLAFCLILCGCGSGSGEETAETTTLATTAATQPPATAATEPTEETTEATTGVTEPISYYSLLSGEPLEQKDTRRPFAIMINNHESALPHCGISAAEVIYETQVEGGMTRFLAIFSDPAAAGAIGSVRSARPPFVGLVQAYDAIYASASGANVVLDSIYAADIDYINGLVYDGSTFYRNRSRLQSGIALEHTMFVDGEDLKALAEELEYRTTRDEAWSTYGFHFDEEAPFDGDAAETIKIGFHSGGKYTTAYYDAESGMYTLYQKGLDYIDGNTGELVEFRNLLILEGESYPMNNGSHVYMENVGEGPGFYARDGKLIPITWSRETEDSPFVYTTADGEVLNMGVGKTYIALIGDGSPVKYE